MRWIRRGILAILCVSLLAGIVAAAWLAVAPRSLPPLKTFVERRVNEATAPYHMHADRLTGRLIYDHGPRLDLTWSHAVIQDGEGQAVASLPEITTRFGIASMFSSRSHLDGVALRRAKMTVTARKDGYFALGLAPRDVSPNVPPPTATKPASIEDIMAAGRRLGSVLVEDSDILLLSEGQGPQLFHTARSRIDLEKNRLALNLRIDSGGQETTINGYLKHRGVLWNGEVAATHLSTQRISALMPKWEALQGLDATADAKADFAFDNSLKPNKLHVSVALSKAKYSNKSIFQESLVFEPINVSLSGQRVDHGLQLNIDPVQITSLPLSLNLAGSILFADNSPLVDVHVTAGDLPLDAVARYWPLPLAPNSRNWVITHLRDGVASGARCRIFLTPDDLKQRHLPSHVIDAEVPLKGATITYLATMPPVTALDARLAISATGLDAAIGAGKSFSAATIRKARVVIPDFNNPAVPLHITADIAGPAQDVATALSPQHLNIGSRLKLDPATIRGSASGTLDLGLVIYPEESGPVRDTHSTVDYTVDAQLENIAQKKLMGKWDIDRLNGHFQADSGRFSIDATTALQDVPGTLSVTQTDEPPQVDYHWKAAALPLLSLPAFGPSLPEGLTGTMGIDANIQETPGQQRLDAELDLAATRIALRQLRYDKAAGYPAKMSLRYLAKTGSGSAIPAFSYRSGEDEVQGSLSFGTDGRIVSAELPSVHLADTQLALHYATTANRTHINLEGQRLDLSPLWQDHSAAKPGDDDPLDILRQLDITARLDEIRLGDHESFRHVGGTLRCGPRVCEQASFNAQTGDGKPISYRIDEAGGTRHLAIQTEDGGELLRVFGISKNIAGGSLTVEGSFDDAAPKRPLNAHVLLNRFRVHDAPTMTKLLSLISPTGFADTVSGQGIRFERLSGDITYAKGDILLKEVRAVGPALGVMVSGAINGGETLALSGTIVPSYTANSLLGKIPLLGNLLLGGEGQGLIAARFSVKGSIENPDVSVNPLSLLTPGFLRNIFSIGDDTPEEAAKRLDKKREAIEKEKPLVVREKPSP